MDLRALGGAAEGLAEKAGGAHHEVVLGRAEGRLGAGEGELRRRLHVQVVAEGDGLKHRADLVVAVRTFANDIEEEVDLRKRPYGEFFCHVHPP